MADVFIPASFVKLFTKDDIFIDFIDHPESWKKYQDSSWVEDLGRGQGQVKGSGRRDKLRLFEVGVGKELR